MTGHAFGFGFGARGSARRHRRRSGDAPPSSGTALPAAANIVGHFNSSDPASLPAQADNSACALWTDLASGVSASQAIASARPRYRAAGGAGINGQPYLQFDGTDDFLLIAAPGAIKAAIDLQEYTVMAVVNACTSSGSNGTVFGDSGTSFALKALSSSVGPPPELLGNRAVSGIDYRAFSVGGTLTDNVATPGGDLRRFAYRGLTYTTQISAPPVTTGTQLAIGARTSGDLRFTGNLYRIIIWNKLLTPAELFQAEMHLNAFYAQEHPIGAAGRVVYIDGDSRNAGIGSDSGSFSYGLGLAGKVETGISALAGTVSQHAIGGNSIAKCITKGAEIDALAQLIERHFPGTKHRLIYEEFFNSRSLILGSPATTGSFVYQTKQYLDARRAGMPGNLKIAGQTPIDHAGPTAANPTLNNPQPGAHGWPAYLLANWSDRSKLGFDGLADVWGTTELGGSDTVFTETSSYTTASGRTLGDGVHLTTLGQGIQAACVAQACLAIPEW